MIILKMEALISSSLFFAESDKYKAVILRIDSPGGDALASDLYVIKLLLE